MKKWFQIGKTSYMDAGCKLLPRKFARIVKTEDGAIALSINTFRYYYLNEMAYDIWQLLLQEDSPIKAYERLLTEYDDIPQEDMYNDFSGVCQFFLDNKLWYIRRSWS